MLLLDAMLDKLHSLLMPRKAIVLLRFSKSVTFSKKDGFDKGFKVFRSVVGCINQGSVSRCFSPDGLLPIRC